MTNELTHPIALHESPENRIPRDLSALDREALLGMRISDLPIRIEGTWLERCVKRLYRELRKKRIMFQPKCYLADEWLTPDREPVVGIAFYLAHPALVRLERKMMLDVEGGTREWCMKLLRHEAGHAINYAYKLYRRKKWQRIFGPFHSEYGDTYRFRPYSRSFVRHLEDYYAQYHPDEDFAETFAVWLTPDLDWRTQYKGWKAIEKLEYVDEIMSSIQNREPYVAKGKEYWKASSLRITLRNFYKKKRSLNAEEFPDFHDANLKRIFKTTKPGRPAKTGSAAELIDRYRQEILQSVSHWTGEKKYIIGDLVATVYKRCQKLNLVLREDEPLSVLRISVYFTNLVTNFIHTGRLRGNE